MQISKKIPKKLMFIFKNLYHVINLYNPNILQ